MATVSATDAKNRFGEMLDIVQTEPVVIQKNGRDFAMLISMEEYRQMEARSSQPKVNPLIVKLHAESVKRWGKVYETLAK